jgi:hypothetical protein
MKNFIHLHLLHIRLSIPFLVLVALLCVKCAPGLKNIPDKNHSFNTPVKHHAIMIAPGQFRYGYYRDANGRIHEYENNINYNSIDTTSSYYRMLRRNKTQVDNKYGEKLREEQVRNLR